MSIASDYQAYLGFLRLNEADEIDWVDPHLLETVSDELKEWVGLPFLQWIHHAFLQVSDVTSGEKEGLVTKVYAVGKPQKAPEFVFRMIPVAGQSLVQICRRMLPAAPEKQLAISNVYGGADETCLLHHWNQLLSWMIPGFLHDANNQLAAMVSLAQCLCSSGEEGSIWDAEQKEDLEAVLKCGKEVGQLFLFLSKVYKWGLGQPNYHDLRELFSDMVQLVDVALPSSFSIEAARVECSMPVYLNPLHLVQLWLGQLSAWYPDRNVRPQGTLRWTVGASLPSSAELGQMIGESPQRPTWKILLKLDDALVQKKSPQSGAVFQSRTLPLLLQKLQGTFRAYPNENQWLLEIPQADMEDSERIPQ